MKKALTAVLPAVLGLVLVGLIAQSLVAGLIGGLVGGLIGGFAAFTLFREAAASSEAAVPDKYRVDPVRDLKQNLQNLLQLNIAARVEAFPAPVLETLERIIDRLVHLLPEANSRYPGTDLTWNVNQAAKDYLPRLVSRYSALNASERDSQATAFVASLVGLEEAVTRAEAAVSGNRSTEFEAVSQFMNARFSDGL